MQDMKYTALGLHQDTRKMDIIRDMSDVGRGYEPNYIFAPNDYLEGFISSIMKNESGI